MYAIRSYYVLAPQRDLQVGPTDFDAIERGAAVDHPMGRDFTDAGGKTKTLIFRSAGARGQLDVGLPGTIHPERGVHVTGTEIQVVLRPETAGAVRDENGFVLAVALQSCGDIIVLRVGVAKVTTHRNIFYSYNFV